ncbi:MAG: DUF2490 domain-containing protein [Saprospiraceae bacterium]
MIKKAITGFVFLALFCHNLAAQQTPARQYATGQNAWFMYLGIHKFNPHWSVHLEAQLRRSDWVAAAQQLLLRTGLSYHFSSQVFATAGYCFVDTYPYGDQPVKAAFPEHRLWEQLQIKTQTGRFEWVNRLRLEQRFLHLPALDNATGVYAPGDAVYSNRMRIFNRVSVPFRGNTIEEKSVYITVYDEVMINFGENVGLNTFDQNRLYVALGYRLPKVGRLEVGYLYQTIFKADGIRIEQNHTLQVGLTSNIDFF